MRPVLAAAGHATFICGLPLPRFMSPDRAATKRCRTGQRLTFMTTSAVAVQPAPTCSRPKERNTGSPSPPSTCGQADDLSEVKGSAGLYIRQEDDAVYLTAASYGDIAAVLANQAEVKSRQPLQGAIRKRLASVVQAQGASRMQIREPEWINGQLRAAWGGQRGGQQRIPRGGQRGGRGSDPWRGPRHYPYLKI